MRMSTAYFAGAGTVMAAIAAGLGGGLLMGTIVSPQSAPQEVTKLEQRMAVQRSQAAPPLEPVQPRPAAGTITAANPPSPPPSPPQPQTEAQTAPPPKSEPAIAPVPAPPAQTAATPVSTTAAASEPAPAQPETKRQTARVSEEWMARSRDADQRRIERFERRRERSQSWFERRRQRQHDDLREVEQAVRDDTEPPKRAFAAEPVRSGMPVIKLFGEQ